MKFKIIATIIFLVIIAVALVLNSHPTQPTVDEYGNPVDPSVQAGQQ
jgi:hypothetical protein